MRCRVVLLNGHFGSMAVTISYMEVVDNLMMSGRVLVILMCPVIPLPGWYAADCLNPLKTFSAIVVYRFDSGTNANILVKVWLFSPSIPSCLAAY